MLVAESKRFPMQYYLAVARYQKDSTSFYAKICVAILIFNVSVDLDNKC